MKEHIIMSLYITITCIYCVFEEFDNINNLNEQLSNLLDVLYK